MTLSLQQKRPLFWIDRGGTFTDCIFLNPNTQETRAYKHLSDDDAPIKCIRKLLELEPHEAIPPCDIRLGTTLATNALLEKKGEAYALVTNSGFADLWRIGHQARPDLFELNISQPTILYDEVLELQIRNSADGSILENIEIDRVTKRLSELFNRGIESLAIVLIHSFKNPDLEQRLGEIAKNIGFKNISLSSDVDRQIGLLERGDTTSIDAYLTPLLENYLNHLQNKLPGSKIQLMQSGGGLCSPRFFRGPNAVLSGPAGGVLALCHLSREMNTHSVGFDMGGTSTDVSRFDGQIDRNYRTEVGGIRLRSEMMSINTVAAGGGSICKLTNGRFCVGPHSAGAKPGPLCYGMREAKDLTVTDINLFLGRISADRFPFPLDQTPVTAALEQLSSTTNSSPVDIANGFLQIANHHMAEAIRRITVAKGHDPRDFDLVVFGGAGGQHACAIANQLGMKRIISHPFAGVFSAYGIGIAAIEWNGYSPEKEDFERLSKEGLAKLTAQGVEPSAIQYLRRADLKYRGTDTLLTLPYDDDEEDLHTAFQSEHLRQFGYLRAKDDVELAGIRVQAYAKTATPNISQPQPSKPATPVRHTPIWSNGEHFARAPVYLRESLAREQVITGPSVILESIATIVVDSGWQATMRDDGVLILDYMEEKRIKASNVSTRDPMHLEVFNCTFMAIAEQMGDALQRTAISTNIRERLDFSCAVFDAKGHLVANAPHIPVHLGAMGETVRSLIQSKDVLNPGEMFVVNDPSLGGSHLPDVTVIAPIHDENGRLIFFTANRGHHSDIGGITPGSMPPFSSHRKEEGCVFSGEAIIEKNIFQESLIRKILNDNPYPARKPDTNIADLKAQVAANRTGEQLLRELVNKYGLEMVSAYMQHIQDNAAECVSDTIERFPDGTYIWSDTSDDGLEIKVQINIEGKNMAIDFEGTSDESKGNLNAPYAVCMAAVIYVIRCMVGQAIPLNHGCLRNVSISIPEQSLLKPSGSAAVAGGNVETSQRIVDCLLAALGLSAASQGTMNNLTFGNNELAYYETIGGGAGAGRTFRGASGCQTHMTNTRITDPEVLEQRFPVRLKQFSLRPGSGGKGLYNGGDGLVREFELLEPLRLSILSDRRNKAPFGLDGGNDGAPGQNWVNEKSVSGKESLDLRNGDVVRIETPGGGGFGTAE